MIDARERQGKRMERAARLACEAVDECRVQLMLKFRFLDLALWRMSLEPVQVHARYPLSTDAHSVFIDPDAVFARFEESFDEMVRDYLHLVLHCIFRHPFDRGHEHHPAWWLACDVMTESVALDICGRRFESPDDARRREIIAELTMQMGKLVPGKLYELFDAALSAPHGETYMGWSQSRLAEIEDLFGRDGHEPWPAFAKSETKEEPGEMADVSEPSDDDRSEALAQEMQASQGDRDREEQRPEKRDGDSEGDDAREQPAGTTEDAPESSEDTEGSTDRDADDSRGFAIDGPDDEGQDEQDDEDFQAWEEISKQIETDLETFSNKWGDEAAGLIDAIALANRKTYDYTEFLKRFSTLAEDMRLNDDEFDYIFYTLGMDLYGNMPLIEPLEYLESDRVREFVIAIDTSGSVEGELVRRFVEHTFEILKESERFGDQVDIHIIQCDARIQSDTHITSMDQLDEYLGAFYVSGFGGTDFRPVFDYVDRLRDRGELSDLRGLVYFTDGLGTFPKVPPSYDVAFAFVEDEQREPPAVPPWAMKVMIDKEAILRD